MAEQVLNQNIGAVVSIRLANGKRLQGRLRSCDRNMNVVLYEAESGNKEAETSKTIFVRGNNIFTILFPKKEKK